MGQVAADLDPVSERRCQRPGTVPAGHQAADPVAERVQERHDDLSLCGGEKEIARPAPLRRIRMNRMLSPLTALASLIVGAAAAPAQTYPTKPVTIIVPAAPGGVTDALGRILAQKFTDAWGQQAIVENKPGANNQIAAEYVAKSAPDGHTLFIGPEVTFVVNPHLYGKLSYDPVKDFTPIAGLVKINHALIVHPSVPAQTVSELLALGKDKPGTLNYGTFGSGSTGHLNMELLQSLSGAKFTAVHYKGATPALTDVMAGHIQMMYISVGSALPQVDSG